MRVLLGLLLVGIAGCGGGSSPPGEGAVPTPKSSQAKTDKPPAQTAAKQKAATRKAVEGQETLTLNGHLGRVTSVSVSPDGKRIVSSSADRTIKIWDISSLDTSK